MEHASAKWEMRMLGLARHIATFSKDPSTQVGAVIFNPRTKTIVTTGYNGFPRGTLDDAHLYEDRAFKYPRVVHAEANAIVDAARQGISTENMHMAVTHIPCSDCAGIVIQAGIKRVIHVISQDDMKRHASDHGSALFQEMGMEIQGYELLG